jgi:hypothetical protein
MQLTSSAILEKLGKDTGFVGKKKLEAMPKKIVEKAKRGENGRCKVMEQRRGREENCGFEGPGRSEEKGAAVSPPSSPSSALGG